MNAKCTIKKIYRIIFVLIAWYGVLGHYVQIVINRAPESTLFDATIDYFSYFTIQSNWLVAAWWTVAIIASGRAAQRWFLSPRVKGALTAYITVTFIVYAVLLAKMWSPTGVDWLYATITHYVTPLAFILDWLLFEKRGTYQLHFLPKWLIYPAAYFIWAMIWGSIIGKALYPFFDYIALGWGGMILQVFLLLVFFLCLGALYVILNLLLGKWFPSKVEA